MKQKLILFMFLVSIPGFAQNTASGNFLYPAPDYNSRRVNGIAITEGVAFTGAMIALHYLWYKNYKHGKFHFFNDNPEWLQMDKMGHATTAYNLAVLGTDMYRWSGVSAQQANILGGISGLVFLSTIEMFDGFSTGWGFSGGDMLANTAGTLMSMGQNYAWNEQRIMLKFSYHQTIYPQYRPEELGSSAGQRIIKDYNGQTYWLSFNAYSILEHNNNLPPWLTIDLGFGAEGMISGRPLPPPADSTQPYFERHRRFFLSPGADFTRFRTKDIGLSTAFKTINFLKCPAPAMEFSPGAKKKLRFHPLYF